MKQLVTNIGVLIALLLVSISANAYDFEVDGWYYNVMSLDDMTCAVTHGSEKSNSYSGTTIQVPATVTYRGRKFSVTRIGDSAFYECENLQEVILPETVTQIGVMAFYCCSNMERINLLNTVRYIGASAFSGCEKLKSVSIPDSLRYFSDYLFEGCKALKEIVIPPNIKDIGEEFIAYSGVERCIIEDGEDVLSMRGAYVATMDTSAVCGSFSKSHIKYLYLGRNFYSKQYLFTGGYYRKTPFLGVESIEEVVVGKYVTELPINTFVGVGRYIEYEYYPFLPNLAKVKILDSDNGLRFVKKWGKYENDFRNVKSAVIERNIRYDESDGYDAFFCDGTIEDVELSKNFTTVYKEMFSFCKKLKTVKLGDNVTTILDKAFERTDNLMKIILTTEQPPVFEGSPGFTNYQYLNAEVLVPDGSLQLYKAADCWKKFWNIKGFSSGIENVGRGNGAMSIIAESGSIRVLNKEDGDVVRVYSVSGTKVAETSENMVANLHKGAYIVTIGSKTYKVLVR